MKNFERANGLRTCGSSPSTKSGAHTRLTSSLLAAAMLTAMASANAQNASAQPAADSGDQLQEIVVTATRRAESIQDVPVSVTAFTQRQMDVQGVKSVDDIARLSPSIQFQRGNGGFGSALGNSISIRGMSSGAGPATTGIYIDDTPVQVGATIASGSFTDNAYPLLFDIQRVEVLNGPQGTLFGSGSEGGAVRFITPPPNMNTATAYVRSEVSTTQYGGPSYESGVAGGAPIIPGVLGFHASVWTRHDGGYIDHMDYYTGQVTSPNNNYQDAVSARVAIGWQPIDNLMITPSVYYQRIKANGANSLYFPNDQVTGSYKPFFPPNAAPVTLPVFQQPYGDPEHGNYVDLHQLNQWSNQRLTLPALKIDYSFSNMELFSNTSYYDREQFGVTDFGGLESGTWAGQLFPPNPAWVFPGADSQGNEFFTQELRLQSTDKDARLSWVVGAFYSNAKTSDSRNVSDPYLGELINSGPFGPCGTPASCMSIFFGPTQLADGVYSFKNHTDLTEKQKAVFGQADLRIVGGLKATVGLRYAKFDTNWENFEGGPVTGTDYPGVGGVPESGAASASSVIPKFMLSYKTDNTLTYLSATKGFRNGGVNAPINNASCAQDLQKLGLTKSPGSYEPDSLWSYELGSKFSTLGGNLVIDGAVYQYDWSNMINNQFLSHCTLSFTTNIGKSQGRGAELAVQYRPIDQLVLSMNAGYHFLKATQTITATSGAISTQNGDALSGGATVNGSAQYNFVVAERPSYFRVDYNYQGPNAFENNPNDSGFQSDPNQIFRPFGYSQTNVRLGTHLGNWDLSVFSNNLLNSQPFFKSRSTVTIFAVDTSLVSATTIRPRVSGVTAVYRF